DGVEHHDDVLCGHALHGRAHRPSRRRGQRPSHAVAARRLPGAARCGRCVGMSDAPRVSRSLAIFDLDHGILKASPAAMLGPQYATAERISRMAGPLVGPLLFRTLSPSGGTSDDIRDAGRTAAATLELVPHASKL